jgi:hypothetical protein
MRFWFLRFALALTICGLSLVAGVSFPKVVHAQMYYGPSYVVPAQGSTVTIPVQVMPQAAAVTVTQPSTVAVTTQPTTAVITQPVYPVVSGSTTGTTDMPPDSCSPYDSWCSYCYYHANPDVCQAYQPGHLRGGGTSSGTPGVGSPSTAPAGSSSSPMGAGGTGNNPGAPTPSH